MKKTIEDDEHLDYLDKALGQRRIFRTLLYCESPFKLTTPNYIGEKECSYLHTLFVVNDKMYSFLLKR